MIALLVRVMPVIVGRAAVSMPMTSLIREGCTTNRLRGSFQEFLAAVFRTKELGLAIAFASQGRPLVYLHSTNRICFHSSLAFHPEVLRFFTKANADPQ
jgi:hypothetical protein